MIRSICVGSSWDWAWQSGTFRPRGEQTSPVCVRLFLGPRSGPTLGLTSRPACATRYMLMRVLFRWEEQISFHHISRFQYSEYNRGLPTPRDLHAEIPPAFGSQAAFKRRARRSVVLPAGTSRRMKRLVGTCRLLFQFCKRNFSSTTFFVLRPPFQLLSFFHRHNHHPSFFSALITLQFWELLPPFLVGFLDPLNENHSNHLSQ